MKKIYHNFSKSNAIYFSVISLTSVFIFIYYVNYSAYTTYGDEVGYLVSAREILDKGLFSLSLYPDSIHTYLLPLIISVFLFLSDGNVIYAKIMMSVFQYIIYLVTVIFIANSTVSHDKNKLMWYSIVSFGFLNPYLIQASTLFLADLLSTCFLVMSIITLIRYDLTRTKNITLGIGFFYLALLIRSTTLVFLPIVVGLILFNFLKHRNVSVLKTVSISIGLTVILIPQVYNNVAHFDSWTPFPAANIYDRTIHFSPYYLKFNSIIVGDSAVGLFYHSPFDIEPNMDIFQMALKYPLEFIFVYSTHVFGVIDWGYAETYIKDFYPLSRILGSLFLYTSVFLILIGIVYSVRNKRLDTQDKFLIIALLISVVLYTAFIGTTLVEARYGYPIWLLLLPVLGYGVKQFYEMNVLYQKVGPKMLTDAKIWTTRTKFLIAYGSYAFVVFYLSFMVDLQTGKINWFSILGF